MNATKSVHTSLRVVAAVAVVVVLAGLLGIRLLALETPPAPGFASPRPPAAVVPAPSAAAPERLAVPCWGCPEAEGWPLRFRTDLDVLAPLGNGAGNAAEFFKDFAKPNGSRFPEATAALARRVDGPPGLDKVLPADDPLLLEAEPWCDQATMRFYPEHFKVDGWSTQLPNLVVPLNLARSWVARGTSAADPARAMEDFRRAIRLGRLLRQENVTVIADLVGLACIRVGAQGIYDAAVRKGDDRLALVAAIVVGEHAPQRLMTSARLTRTDLKPYLRKSGDGTLKLALPDTRLEAILAAAKGDPDRRFRCEAIIELNVVRSLGTKPQQERASGLLAELAVESDPIVAATAAWSRDTESSAEALAGVFQVEE